MPKLGKFIALLASDKEHEVLAAVSAMKRQLAVDNLDFNDLARHVDHTLSAACAQKISFQGVETVCVWLLAKFVTAWERNFLNDIKYQIHLSEKQLEILTTLAARYKCPYRPPY